MGVPTAFVLDAACARLKTGVQRCHALKTETRRRLVYDGVVLIPTAAEVVGKQHDAGAAVAPRTDLRVPAPSPRVAEREALRLVLTDTYALPRGWLDYLRQFRSEERRVGKEC